MKYNRIFTLVFSFCFSCSLFAQYSSPQKTAQFEAYIQALKNRELGGAVSVEAKGKTVYRSAFGLANREWQIASTTDTRYRLASVTKQFTALLILQQVQEGKLSLKGTISDYLPYYRQDIGARITIHQLLTHTSGLPSYTDNGDFFISAAKNQYDPEAFVLQYCSGDLLSEPGTTVHYNNSAYFILGAILEKVSGKSYAQLIRERIFEPFGMQHSGYDNHDSIIPKRAAGYSKGEANDLQNAMYIDMSVPYSAGSLYSTVEDLALWDRALYTDKLLAQPLRDSLFNAYHENFGYGWVISSLFGKKAVMHSGGIPGFSTFILRIPEDEVCVIVLFNSDFADASATGRDLAAILYDKEYTIPRQRKAISLDPALMKKYEGEYQLAPAFFITVTLEGTQLYIQGTGQSRIAVHPESEADFFVRDMEIGLTFEKDKKQKVTGLVLYQNGHHPAKKVK